MRTYFNKNLTIIILLTEYQSSFQLLISINKKLPSRIHRAFISQLKFMNTSNELFLIEEDRVLFCNINSQQNDFECIQYLTNVSKGIIMQIADADEEIIISDSFEISFWRKFENSENWILSQSIKIKMNKQRIYYILDSQQQQQLLISQKHLDANRENTCRLYIQRYSKWKYFRMKKIKKTTVVYQFANNFIATSTILGDMLIYRWYQQGDKMISRKQFRNIKAFKYVYCNQIGLLFAFSQSVLWVIKKTENNQFVVKDMIICKIIANDIVLNDEGRTIHAVASHEIISYQLK